MNPAYLVLTTLGSVVAFITGVVLIIRAILKNVNATGENTKALIEVRETIGKLDAGYSGLNTRVAVLEDRVKRQ